MVEITHQSIINKKADTIENGEWRMENGEWGIRNKEESTYNLW